MFQKVNIYITVIEALTLNCAKVENSASLRHTTSKRQGKSKNPENLFKTFGVNYFDVIKVLASNRTKVAISF